jgi:CHAT domain-containing protein/Tfp pilus assembly protein PilF
MALTEKDSRFSILFRGRACATLCQIQRRCWFAPLPCALSLCLISTIVSGQQSDTRNFTDDQFFFAILSTASTNPSTTKTLLTDNKSLIGPKLWKRLIDTAEYSPNPSAIYALTLQVANELPDRRLRAITLYKTGWYQFGQGNIASAIERYLQSKTAFEESGSRRDLIYIFADLGTLSIYSSDYTKAKEYSEQSLAVAQDFKSGSGPTAEWPDEYGVGTALSNLGNISKRQGEYDNAVDYFQKSLVLYKKIDAGNGRYGSQIIDSMADIGRTYSAMGDYVHAMPYLDRAMALAKISRNINRIASICNSLGILYTNQRDYTKAIEFFQEGLQLANQVNDRFKQASLLLNIAVAYQFQKNSDRALEGFEASLRIAKEINDKEILIHIGEGIGAVYQEQGKYTSALESLHQSLALAKSIEDRTRIAELLWRKAEVYYAQGDFTESVVSASEASKIADQLSLRNVSYLALTTLGRAYRGRHEDKLAAEAFSRAIDGIEGLRNQVAGLEQENQLFFEDKVGPYHEMVDLLLIRPNQEDTFKALLFAERAKARVLRDVLSSGRIDLAKAMSEQEREEERRLNKEIVDLNRRISAESGKEESDPVLTNRLNQQLSAARLKYESFQDSLYASHAELRGQRRQPPPLAWNDVSDLVRDHRTAYLQYVVTNSKTYLFVLSSNDGNKADLRMYSIDISEKNLARLASEFREMLANQSPTFADASRELYDLLIKPAADQLKGQKTLCILPDGVLWDLPFQALQLRDDRYLLENFAIYYAPSLSVLKEMSARKNKSQSASPSLLAFGNPRLESEVGTSLTVVYRSESLAPLPEAEVEVKALKEIWKPAPSKIFVGQAAQKSVFKSEASKYAYIHLATHGILDDGNPMYSRLVMSRAANDQNDDGLLEAREIMQLNLHADLVVLSACQTARGRFGAGEGMIGMSWAFFVAGAPTMVASQWKVDSGATAMLMIEFHKQMKEGTSNGGASKASALRLAALELIKQTRYRHPFFWAGFVMIGDGR